MNRTSLLALCGVLLAAVPHGRAQSAEASGCLDALIDWKNPWALTSDKFKQAVEPLGKDAPAPVYTVRTDSTGHTHYELNLAATPALKLNVLEGQVPLQDFACVFKAGRLMRISFHVKPSSAEGSDAGPVELLGAAITAQVDDPDPVSYRQTRNDVVRRKGTEWVHANYIVRMFDAFRLQENEYRPSGVFAVEFYRKGANPPYEVLPIGEEKTSPQPLKIEASLDALLNFAAFWQWTPEDLEKHYIVKAARPADQEEPPQFEWLNASKDRARLSRHMFGDVETKLTMFAGSINVEEAVIEFVNGRAARATVSFYNRGDSGEIKTSDFERIFKIVGQSLGQVTKVPPQRQILSSNAALPVAGWIWKAPATIALLEHNEYNTPGKPSQPEFLRLKLAAPNQADWSMGKLAVGIQRMELLKRVTRTPEGDVYLSGVPMVDQGQKGYCVAASCQRLFEYMRIPCDQHEMAKLVSVDAETGADIMTMQKSLARIDGAFKVAFKPLVNPEQYYSTNRKRRVSEKEFVSLVKEYTDKGVPLLWGLVLGRKPENPPLPNGGQVSGGHMRLIIGYNSATHQLLFTDSWGSGHELKRMEMLDAYDVTMGLYSMAPRGL